MRKKKQVSQAKIDDISEFLIQEFLQYYPFNTYQFLLESLSDLNLNSSDFTYSINLLSCNSSLKKNEIENSLWIATIRQRLKIKMRKLQIDKDTFKTILITIKSTSRSKEKSIVCDISFVDAFDLSYSGKQVRKTIKYAQGKFFAYRWLFKLKHFLYS